MEHLINNRYVFKKNNMKIYHQLYVNVGIFNIIVNLYIFIFHHSPYYILLIIITESQKDKRRIIKYTQTI